jgi:hypothetical protein
VLYVNLKGPGRAQLIARGIGVIPTLPTAIVVWRCYSGADGCGADGCGPNGHTRAHVGSAIDASAHCDAATIDASARYGATAIDASAHCGATAIDAASVCERISRNTRDAKGGG